MFDFITQFAAGCGAKGISLFPAWYKYVETSVDETGRCSLDFSFPTDLGAVMLAVVEILLRLGAIVAIGYVIYGGFLYMLTRGEPDKAKEARVTIMNALIGLAITIVATGVISFIGGQLIK